LTRAGHPHQFVIVEGAPHSFHLQPKQQDLRPLVTEFLDKYLRGPAEPGRPASREASQSPQFEADFFRLCDLAAREVNSPQRKVPFYQDSYAVRALAVAYDMTGQRRFLDACRTWSGRMMAKQEKMTPAGAYSMNYGRKPGETKGGWYVADSSSIALGVLATAGRCRGPEREKYLHSVKAFTKLVIDNYVRPSGGVTDGIWPKSDKEWWCSTGIFGSLAALLFRETNDLSYRAVALGAIDWLNGQDLTQTGPYTLQEMGPCMIMYVLEAYSAGWPLLEPGSPRQKAALKQMAFCLDWMAKNQASRGVKPAWDYNSQWGSKFGGLPFHMLVYARHFPGNPAVAQAAEEELRHVGRQLAATAPGLSQLAVFALMSYAERIRPGAIYAARVSGS